MAVERSKTWRELRNTIDKVLTEVHLFIGKGTDTMAQKYRLVRVDESDNPSNEQSHVSRHGQGRSQDAQYIQEPTKSHPLRWILGIAAVIAITLVAVWMNVVSTSLSHLGQLTAQNAHTLSQNSSKLSGIQAGLNALSHQFYQMQAEMQRFFTAIMQSLHGR